MLKNLQQALETLGLGEMQKALEQELGEPSAQESRLEWLWRLLEPQLQRRIEGRVERRIREARLPVRKTFADFDFSFQPKLDRDLILELGTLRFIDQGKNVLLAGMSGTGKSHIALALGLLGCSQNRRVLYTTSAAMLARLTASLADQTLASQLKPYTHAELLIIDEVGLEQVERSEARRAGLMQKVLVPRYNAQQATIITSNIPWTSWGEYLDDHLGATALLDRLLHHSHVIVIDGPSYREWVHRQERAQKGAQPTEPAAPATSKAAVTPKPRPGAAKRAGGQSLR